MSVKVTAFARENYPTVEIHLKMDARLGANSIIDQERVDYISIQVPWLSTCGSTAASLAFPWEPVLALSVNFKRGRVPAFNIY